MKLKWRIFRVLVIIKSFFLILVDARIMMHL